MRSYWEQIGMLGPTYRLLGRGWSDRDIAVHLGRDEELVSNCVGCILRFLQLETRAELALRANPANPMLMANR